MKAEIIGIAVLCPKCGRAMLLALDKGLSCVNSNCELYDAVFEPPKIEIELVEVE